ncbi:universal stress protein [Trueperella bialowiezensis]|uniref:Universal stress protein family n=1 Tax=Trueperella bialowiezensis TaxID=312285 RepID=A0A3S4UXV0_9ACTO|nr:universal stress protein [Trueperella bialowiezensis]VEI12521.1 Universal stress protein family [Trueperella bialowiezensis]
MAIIVPMMKSEHALHAGIDIARRRHDTLVALFIRPVAHSDQHLVDEEVDGLAQRLDQADIAFRVEVRLTDSEPSRIISDVAQEFDAGLVVVSAAAGQSHGKYMLGTQIQKLLIECPCSVLVVRE